MKIIKFIAPISLGCIGLGISAKALVGELTTWALLLFISSLVVLLVMLLRPLFIKRNRGSVKSSGLPSKYERVRDPWRALSAGQDPTE